jgi:hypothetical protein
MTVLEEEAAKSPRHKILLAALHLHGATFESTPESALSLLLDAERCGAEVPPVLLHAAVELSPLTVQALWATRALESAPWTEISRDGAALFERAVPLSLLVPQVVFGNPGLRVEQLVALALQYRSDIRQRLPSDHRPNSVVSISFSFEDLGNGQGVFHFTSPEASDELCVKLPEIVLEFSRFLAEGWRAGPGGALTRTFSPFSPLCLTVFHALNWASSRSEENLMKFNLFEKGLELKLQDMGWGGMAKTLDGTPPSQLSDHEMYQLLAFFVDCGFDMAKSIPTSIHSAVLAFAEQRQLTAELTVPQSLVARIGVCQEF